MSKLKLNPDNRYLFIDVDGNSICVDTLPSNSYFIEDKGTYIQISIVSADNIVIDEYVLYIQATSKDVI